MSEREFVTDVAIVGAGPSGLTAANLLADRGWRVALIERHPNLFGLPRAGHIDHEAFRILQGTGCLHPVLETAQPKKRNVWLDRNGDVLLEFKHWAESTSGFFSGSMYQPDLEEALLAGLRHKGNLVNLYQGYEVAEIGQSADDVTLTARPFEKTGEPLTVTARYVIAADGAQSKLRDLLDIERDEFAVAERWMVVDVAYGARRDFGPTAVVGDPRRPHFYGTLGREHHRFEWKLFDEEDTQDYLNPDRAWELLAVDGVKPGEVEIIRQAVFVFEYKMARNWLSGRIALIGDAAHTMPPTMGQGLCSGMRDAANLAWKLDLVMRGLSQPSLLETYQSERYPHVKAWADLSKQAGEIAFVTDITAADARDEKFRRGKRPDMGGTPLLGEGAFSRADGDAADIGKPFPQRMILHQGEEIRFDDLAGYGFCVVGLVDSMEALDAEGKDALARLGCSFLYLGDSDQPRGFADLDGFYTHYFEEQGARFFILRPDKYILASARDVAELADAIRNAATAIAVKAVEPA